MSALLAAIPPTGMTSRHSSESNEHYTPADIVERARRVLGEIDLDPASCDEANRTVAAKTYFSASDNGYRRQWGGRVFLNPPGGLSDDLERPVKPKCWETGSCGLPPGHKGHHGNVQSNQKKWWYKLAREHAIRHVDRAIFVCFSLELFQTTQVDPPIPQSDCVTSYRLPLQYPICFPRNRISYRRPGGATGNQPPHSSAIVYLDYDTAGVRLFAEAFASLGHVVIPEEYAPACPRFTVGSHCA